MIAPYERKKKQADSHTFMVAETSKKKKEKNGPPPR